MAYTSYGFRYDVSNGVAEKFVVHGQVADGVGLLLEFASECYLHVSILFVPKEKNRSACSGMFALNCRDILYSLEKRIT